MIIVLALFKKGNEDNSEGLIYTHILLEFWCQLHILLVLTLKSLT